jgi:hypothetical protein
MMGCKAKSAASARAAIRFTGIEPEFDARGTGFYRATWNDRPIKAGITNEAWVHLLPHHRPYDGGLDDLEHPVHRTARAFIQEKLDAEGTDASGAVVVTLSDISAHAAV